MSSRFLFDPSNILILPATIAGTFLHADWKGARKRSGMLGLTAELAQSVAGTNTMAFFIPTDSDWAIQDIQALLIRYGVKLWGVGYWNGEMYFRVKKRQAHWAQYVMLRAGVPLLHGLMDTSRALPTAARNALEAPGTGAPDRVLAWLGGLLDADQTRPGTDQNSASRVTSREAPDSNATELAPRLRIVMCDSFSGNSAVTSSSPAPILFGSHPTSSAERQS